MAAFVRFVFTIMIVGIAVNLLVVLAANSRSQHTRAVQYEAQAQQFTKLAGSVDRHVRRADIIVESQRVDARGNALESTLLLRQYRDVGTGQEQPLPVVRIVIPGDRLQAGGLHLKFGSDFAGDGGEYQMLANKDIVLFGLFCGADETAPTNPSVTDERFTFLVRDKVPPLLQLTGENSRIESAARALRGGLSLAAEADLTRDMLGRLSESDLRANAAALGIDPKISQQQMVESVYGLLHRLSFPPQPSYFEMKLWQYLWSQLPEVPTEATLPWDFELFRPEDVQHKLPSLLKATWCKPATITVRRVHTYSAFIDSNGISLSEDEPGIVGLLDNMLKEGEMLNLVEEP